jgi:GT2 family glycosyltransferase
MSMTRRDPSTDLLADDPTARASTCPLASVIVVNTNELHHLRDCLPTLMRQTHPYYEVLLVDNGSTDGSLEYVTQTFPGVRIVANGANLGYAGANNVGFAQALGEYIAVLNPDTLLDENWLLELTKPFLADPTVGLTTPKILLASEPTRLNACGNDVTLTGLTFCRGLGQPADRYDREESVPAVSGAAFVISRKVLEEIGSFDEEFFIYYEDTDLSLRAMLAGYLCVFVPSSVVYHKYVFKFSAQKCFLQERNRYFSLMKTLRWRTALALLPMLAMSELIAWGYIVTRGPAHIRGKLRSYAWILSHLPQIMRSRSRVQALRRRDDRALLALMGNQLTLAHTASPRMAALVENVLNPILFVMGRMSRGLVTW